MELNLLGIFNEDYIDIYFIHLTSVNSKSGSSLDPGDCWGGKTLNLCQSHSTLWKCHMHIQSPLEVFSGFLLVYLFWNWHFIYLSWNCLSFNQQICPVLAISWTRLREVTRTGSVNPFSVLQSSHCGSSVRKSHEDSIGSHMRNRESAASTKTKVLTEDKREPNLQSMDPTAANAGSTSARQSLGEHGCCRPL